ncbi:MAG: hypothetical protein PHN18_03280 [Sulfurospirillaceae bacterium]|nr:hypothetical protein [Sulfurospirillaceae bacterium]MDD2825570.1 hypothetical protein [Sulfurospirillaceae bacterium]
MKNCDFNLIDVYKRCDKLGARQFDFVLQGGMSTQKVLKVLLYREIQFLELRLAKLHQEKVNALKKLTKTLQNIIYLFHISKDVFDSTIIESYEERFVIFETIVQMKETTALSDFLQIHYPALLFDLHFFFYEPSAFYLENSGEKPLRIFVKKHLHKEYFRMAKKIKKSLIENRDT